MTAGYHVRPTRSFEHTFGKLAERHVELVARFQRVIHILESDPYNVSRSHPIKKLKDVQAGDGQYRIREGRFRFRYDIEGQTVYLKACSLGREDTYR